MSNNFLKYLNNQITIWENLYGDFYTLLYDSNDKQRPEEVNNEQAYRSLKECLTVVNVLKKIKRNRFKKIKVIEKKKYRIYKGVVW